MTWTAVSMCQPQPRGRKYVTHLRRKSAIGGLDDGLRRPRRVQIDRDIKRVGAFENRPEEFVVEVAAANVAVDQRALEAVLAHRALQLVGGLVRNRGRQRGETGEARRMLLHRFRQHIVGVARQRERVGGLQLLGARRIERQHLHIDAGRVHFRQSVGADVAELFEDFGAAGAGFQNIFFELPPGAIEKSRRRKVLFKGYGAHEIFSARYDEASRSFVCPWISLPSLQAAD